MTPKPGPLLKLDAGNKGGLTCPSEHHSDEEDCYETDQDLTFDIGGATSTDLEISDPVTTQADDMLIVGSQQQPHEAIQDLQDSASLENALDSLDSLFPDSVMPYLRVAVTEGIKAIFEIISASQFDLTLQSTRDEVLEHLKALIYCAKAAKLDNVILPWIISQAHNLFKNKDVIAVLESTLYSTALNVDLAYEEKNLAELKEKSLAMKEREREIAIFKEKLRTMEESLARDREALAKRTAEIKHSIQLATQRKRDLEKMEQEGKAKLEDINLKKARLQTLITTFTSFASSINQ